MAGIIGDRPGRSHRASGWPSESATRSHRASDGHGDSDRTGLALSRAAPARAAGRGPGSRWPPETVTNTGTSHAADRGARRRAWRWQQQASGSGPLSDSARMITGPAAAARASGRRRWARPGVTRPVVAAAPAGSHNPSSSRRPGPGRCGAAAGGPGGPARSGPPGQGPSQ